MISFSVEENDNYSEEEMHIIGREAEKFFETEHSEDQLPGEDITYLDCKEKWPYSFNIIKDGTKPIGFSFALPSTENLTKQFLNKKLNEKEFYYKIKNDITWEKSDSIYLCATIVNTKYQRRGIGLKARITQIKKLQSIHPNLKKLFCWTYTKEGKQLIKKVSKKINQEIFIRD